MVENGKLGFLDPMTENCSRLVSYHDMVMVVGVGVMLIVISFLAFALCRSWALEGYICRFKTKCNWLEFCWTLIPGLILAVVGYFSWENLYRMELTEKADYHVKVVGHQWYWEYEYYLGFLGTGSEKEFLCEWPSEEDSLTKLVYWAKKGWVPSLQSLINLVKGLPSLSSGEKKSGDSSLLDSVEASAEMIPADQAGVSSYLDVQQLLSCLGVFDPKCYVKGLYAAVGDVHLSYDSYGLDSKLAREEVAGVAVEDENIESDLLPFLGQRGVDQVLYLPLNKTTEVVVCTADVIHSWGVPALGVKMDAVPGRANHLGVRPYRVGYAYGNCYELCGYGHSVMPITVLVLPEPVFLNRLAEMLRQALRAD
uniref:cytochrome c oxidase subunit II n=1 Tax=Nototeredo knoxi TaxID=2939324 RepID=UPI0020278BD9|nr:cytochrome c oxidase subunit II [Nototeredo knoxi]UPX89278.1 cytochrome c oxidase subunit 2 [Nototeredo knoxi]